MPAPLPQTLLALLLTVGTALAVPLRIVTFNIEANRDLHGNVTEALNDPGTIDYISVRDILLRIDADVVCLQELANADIAGGTNGGTSSDVHSLAADLGRDQVYIPTSSGAFDFSLRNAILSRYPILDMEDIGSAAYLDSIGSVGPGGGTAKDVTRVMPAVVIDVPGAAQPTTVLTLHAKSDTGPANRFRRAVEFARVEQYLANNGLDATDNIIILGDFNLSDFTDTFTSEPTNGMPGTWKRGTEIALPITYSIDPDFYFPAPYNLVALDPRDLNGDPYTFESGDTTIDFILPSPALTNTGSEIYRSNLDVSNNTGLPKSGSPLNDPTSTLASDHFAVFADFILADEIEVPEYVFTSPTGTILETFDSETGTADPPNWTSDPADNWLGPDDGTANSPGKYAYGTTESALGLLSGGATTTFTAQYHNNTGTPIVALQLAYQAEQWGVLPGGSPDTWSVELIIDGLPLFLGALEFTADTTGTTSPGTTTPLSVILSNLSIPNNSSFLLRFTATPGIGAAPPSTDVFLNEFHYDNIGEDEGEFVEVVTAPGFTGTAADIEFHFYTGSNGTTYHSALLSAFTPGSQINGYQFYSLFPSSIQNGNPPDGFAIVDTRTNTLLHFLSYEGTLTATSGQANGLTSTEIGQTQSNTSTPAGMDAIGLTGQGSESSDLLWTKFTGLAHTPGALNPGQSLATPGAPPQGIAIDNVSLTLLLDTDSDGDPDLTDPDDDNDSLTDTDEATLGTNPLLADSDANGTNDGDEDADHDGQSNAAELNITLTNPLDRNSLFTITIAPDPGTSHSAILAVPSLPGRTYTVWRSTAPGNWTNLGSTPGTGTTLLLPVPGNAAFATNLFRVEATLD